MDNLWSFLLQTLTLSAVGVVLLAPPLWTRRLYRWQGAACLGLYGAYLAAVLLVPLAGA